MIKGYLKSTTSVEVNVTDFEVKPRKDSWRRVLSAIKKLIVLIRSRQRKLRF